MNDDRIFGDEPNGDRFYVRRYFTHRDDVLNKLINNFTNSDLSNTQELQLREYSIKLLFWLHQLEPTKLKPMLIENLYLHRGKLQSKIESNDNSDLNGYYNEEIELVDEAINAPNRPFKTNYIKLPGEDKLTY